MEAGRASCSGHFLHTLLTFTCGLGDHVLIPAEPHPVGKLSHLPWVWGSGSLIHSLSGSSAPHVSPVLDVQDGFPA